MAAPLVIFLTLKHTYGGRGRNEHKSNIYIYIIAIQSLQDNGGLVFTLSYCFAGAVFFIKSWLEQQNVLYYVRGTEI